MNNFKYDFSGYVTKNDVLCTDGRIIKPNAFKPQDGTIVPLLFQHDHNDVNNCLGHMLLENREDGVYGYGSFNKSDSGIVGQNLVEHGDVTDLSIFASDLIQNGREVVGGKIREVSLVLNGANPDAFIDTINVSHGADGHEDAIIYFGLKDEELNNTKGEIKMNKSLRHAANSEKEEMSIDDILESMTPEQLELVMDLANENAEMIESLDDEDEYDEEDYEDEYDEELGHSEDYGRRGMKFNVFNSNNEMGSYENTLSHADFENIMEYAHEIGSVKDAFLAHADTYGIKNIDLLFPDAVDANGGPTLISRDMGWVGPFLAALRKSPFSRIKSIHADITANDARAKGYITATLKKDEVFKLLKRETYPQTIYKKQKIDRDDVIDITSIDVIAFLKAEMKVMLNEEIARACLVGDGREISDPDKIKDDKIRNVWKDSDLYAHHVNLDSAAKTTDFIEAMIRARKHYKGVNPSLYLTTDLLNDMLLLKKTDGSYLYETIDVLKTRLRVKDIIEVPVMENLQREVTDTTTAAEGTELNTKLKLLGILLNPTDYTVGATKGGEVSFFDDFDIDYNQNKYLIETRMSGALTVPKTALVFEQKTV